MAQTLPLYLAASLYLFPPLLQAQNVLASEVIDDNPNMTEITRLLRLRLSTDDLADPVRTNVDGIYEVRFGDKIGYISADGRYIFMGDMIDLENGYNLTETARTALVVDQLSQVSPSHLVVYPAKGDEKTVLSIFTDTSCPYCKKLHEEVPYLQAAGISVHYFPFPRGGDRGPGYANLKQVWCAENKALAMDIAKGIIDGNLGDYDCDDAHIVDLGYELGNSLGVTGTPALFTSDGAKIDGYVPYQQLIPMLLNEH